MVDDNVQLTDLEVIQQFSLAVRGATASRADVIAALEADLAYLGGSRRAAPKGAAAERSADEPLVRAAVKAAARPPARTAAKAPDRPAKAAKAPAKAPAKVATKASTKTPVKAPGKTARARRA